MTWLIGDWSRIYLADTALEERWLKSCWCSGIYRLIGLQNTLTPAQICRACGTDPTGTLYLGQTTNLYVRLSSLVRSKSLYRLLPDKLAEQFPSSRLGISWQQVEAPQLASRERELLRNYIAEFGDRPPLMTT